jgi:hypothetical protein
MHSFTAFALYTCVFAFRKAFPAATYSGLTFGGLDYKSWLVISQVLGYGAAKFVGIKTISELKAHSRSFGILLMVSIAALSWLLFAIVPAPYNIIFLFVNGFPLGMVWGMVFRIFRGQTHDGSSGSFAGGKFYFLLRFVPICWCIRNARLGYIGILDAVCGLLPVYIALVFVSVFVG